MGTVLIYGLYDPRTDALRYIGKTKSARCKVRLMEHCSSKTIKQRHHRSVWIQSLLKLGLKPEMRVIEETTEQCWQERERFWVEYFRHRGADLTNTTDGGDGGATMRGKTFSDDHRKAISAALIGHPVSDFCRQRFYEMRKSPKWQSPNFREIPEEELREMYLARHLTSYQIAETRGMSPAAIQYKLRKLGIARSNSEAHKGKVDTVKTRMKRSSLRIEDVEAIKRELQTDRSQVEIAHKFGVSKQTITNIKQGKRWEFLDNRHLVKAAFVDSALTGYPMEA